MLTPPAVAQMYLDDLHPAIWPSAHSDLSRLVTTDQCMLSHCCDIVAGTQSSSLFEVMNVNQTLWCEASLNLTLCYDTSGWPRPSSEGCSGFWDVSNRNGCIVGICAVWLLTLVITLHARWLGARLAGETACCKCGGLLGQPGAQQPKIQKQASEAQRAATRPNAEEEGV